MLITWNIEIFTCNKKLKFITNQIPIYQIKKIITISYNSIGKINYKLKAENIICNKKNELNMLNKVIIGFFDKNSSNTWLICSNYAKLNHNKILYLYGNVIINNLNSILKIQKIKTNNAQINLINQNIFSNEKVIFYGKNFISYGMKMYGNLKTKKIELINNVKTKYNIQNKIKNSQTINIECNFNYQDIYPNI
ncbi:Lipopolysaccharide export system protein LptC [Serratia symbiotica]|nr:Lipopolysaccharide export system protein LptC [Serratia symbiotica]